MKYVGLFFSGNAAFISDRSVYLPLMPDVGRLSNTKHELSKTPSKLMISTGQQTFENHRNFCVQILTRVCCCSESALVQKCVIETGQRFKIFDRIEFDQRTNVSHDMRCFVEGLPHCVYGISSHCFCIYAEIHCRGKNY